MPWCAGDLVCGERPTVFPAHLNQTGYYQRPVVPPSIRSLAWSLSFTRPDSKMIRRVLRRAVMFILLVGLAVVAGCTQPLPPMGTFVGRVTYKGEPVPEGTVYLIDSKSGSAATGILDQGGRYKAVGKLMPGNYIVFIQPPIVDDVGNGKMSPRKVTKEMESIPEVCRNQLTSPLRVEIPNSDPEPVLELGDLKAAAPKSKARK